MDASCRSTRNEKLSSRASLSAGFTSDDIDHCLFIADQIGVAFRGHDVKLLRQHERQASERRFMVLPAMEHGTLSQGDDSLAAHRMDNLGDAEAGESMSEFLDSIDANT